VAGPSLSKAVLIAGAALIAVVVIYYAVIFEGSLPDHPAIRGYNDTVLHVAAFLALSVPLLLLWAWRRTVAGLIVLAGLIEIVQMFDPGRTADWRDFAASLAGIFLGGLVVSALRGIKLLVNRSEK
jgi:VanZ family protein